MNLVEHTRFTVHTSRGRREAIVLKVLKSGISEQGNGEMVKEVKYQIFGEKINQTGIAVRNKSENWELDEKNPLMSSSISWQ